VYFFKKLLISLRGLKIAFKEKSFLLEIILGLLILSGILFSFIVERISLIILLYILLLVTEILNTAIEKLSNKLSLSFDEDIRDIKDLGSAAVFLLLSALMTLIAIS
jgi:diacylglycerol kinase (ATP)